VCRAFLQTLVDCGVSRAARAARGAGRVQGPARGGARRVWGGAGAAVPVPRRRAVPQRSACTPTETAGHATLVDQAPRVEGARGVPERLRAATFGSRALARFSGRSAVR
jgi:hypothetical protein